MKPRYDPLPTPSTPEGALIKRRRLQILVHSCLYYGMDESLVPDGTFDRWCRELVELQAAHPGAYSDRFDAHFVDWDGVSGYDLPIRDPWVWNKAAYLIALTNGELT